MQQATPCLFAAAVAAVLAIALPSAATAQSCSLGVECVYSPGSPIVISLDPHGRYRFTSAAEGVLFDINGDGVAEQVAWTRRGSRVAFLALDRNEDGVINDGTELFGTHTVPGATNGFLALSALAVQSNGGVLRGSVSADDPLFAKLLLWEDRNHDGASQGSELSPASRVFSDIGVSYLPMTRKDEYGNAFAYRGWAHVRSKSGRNRATSPEDDQDRTIEIWDVFFALQ